MNIIEIQLYVVKRGNMELLNVFAYDSDDEKSALSLIDQTNELLTKYLMASTGATIGDSAAEVKIAQSRMAKMIIKMVAKGVKVMLGAGSVKELKEQIDKNIAVLNQLILKNPDWLKSPGMVIEFGFLNQHIRRAHFVVTDILPFGVYIAGEIPEVIDLIQAKE